MLEVDGQGIEVDPTMTLLDACRRAGARVDAFCHDDRVASGGHCRACMVEVGARFFAACSTPVWPDAAITTRSERLDAYRRDLGELMWTEARVAGEVAHALSRWGAAGTRYASEVHTAPSEIAKSEIDHSHPYLRLDLTRCIRCRLCERACDGIQGQHVFSFQGRGATTRLGFGEPGLPFVRSACVACGACAAICPTGALSDVDRDRVARQVRTTRTTCGYCGVGCQLEVHVGLEGQDRQRDDAIERVLRIDGVRNAAVNAGHLCIKGRYAHGFSRHPDRLVSPLLRKNGHLTEVSWDEALDFVTSHMQRLRGAVGGLSSSRCTNEENYLFQKWMRAGLGTHNVDCCARVCHAPTAAGMKRSLGTGAATNALEDIAHADLFLVAGSNTTEAHPVTGARIRQQVLRGRAKLIVIDPRRTELAEVADVHLMLRPGTNVPLLNALAHALIALELVDRDFVSSRTDGFDELAAFLEDLSPERTEATTGVPARLVWRAASLYGQARRPMQLHGLGMTEHVQGSESVMLLCNLALLVGAFGREGVGVNPLRGQNNVQGAADMGCQPDLLTGYLDPQDPVIRSRVERLWGAPLPTHRGLTLPRMYDAARTGKLRALYILGEDVVQTDPGVHVDEALARLELLVVQELFLSETAKRAHVVLPGSAFLEKDGTFTNGERRVQRVRKCLEPPAGAREDWRILLELMARSGIRQTLSSPQDIYREIAIFAPILAGVNYERLEPDGLQWPVPTPEHAGTPRLHTAAFPIGRAPLMRVRFTPSPSFGFFSEEDFPLKLVTGRVLPHYNSGSMTRRSAHADLAPRDAMSISPRDAARFNLEEGSEVLIESPWGEAKARLEVSARIADGTAFLTFHHPETHTNALMGPYLDGLADCPEYKLTPVRIRARSIAP
jgi:formate dehydrogenase alpha subunit